MYKLIIATFVLSILLVGIQAAHGVDCSGTCNQNATESLGVADNRNSNQGKALSETMSLSDVLTTTVQFIKNLNESLVLTDTNVRAFSRKLDETLTLSDTVNARISVRNLSESLTLSDAVSKSTTMNLAESLALSDTVSARITVKGLQESLSLADTVSARITVKNLSESLTLSDATFKTVSKNITETLTLSDTTNARISVRNLSESLALSDAVNARISVRNLGETITLADAVSNTITKNLAESITLSDALNTRISVKNLSETLNLSDVVSTSSVKNLSETLTSSDTVTTSLSVTKNLSESLTLFDTANARISVKNLAETITLSDTANASITVKNLSESLSLADTVSNTITKNLSESLTLSDAVNARISVKNLSESITLSDAANVAISFKNLAETFTLSDAVSNTVTKNLSETITLSDAVSARITVKNLSESLTLSDTASAAISFKNLAETLTLSDAVSNTITKNLAESITLSDALSARISVKNLSETLALSDANNAAISVKSLSESLTLSDSVSNTITKNLSESLTLSDTVNAKIPVKEIQDTLTLSDTVNARISVKNLDESLALSDAISNTITKNLSESLTLSDAVNARISVKNLDESLALSDAVNAGVIVKSLSETITLSDAISNTITKNLSESLTLSDVLSATITIKGLQETLALSDAVNSGVFVKNLAETITLSDASTTSSVIALSESLALSDVIDAAGLTSSARTETINVSDVVELTYTIPVPTGTLVTNSFLGGAGEGTVTFSEVTTAGEVSVTTSTVTEPPPDGFTIIGLGGSTIAIDITTTAAFTGTVQICVTYDDTGLDAKQESVIRLQHFVGGIWVDITSSLDNASNIICGVTDSLSPFAVMVGQVEIGGSSRERTRYEISDVLPPIITEHYIKPEQVSKGDDIVVSARISDDVGIAEATVIYLTNLKIGPPEFHQVSMQKFNAEWWRGTIPGSDVNTDGLAYWIAGTDFGGNVGNSVKVDLKVGEAKPKTEAKQKPIPFTSQNNKVDLQPNDFIEVSTMEGKKMINKYYDTVIIKNNSNSTVNSIRIMLSPGIANSFYLDKYAIRSLEPYGNVTVAIKLFGNPNQDTSGKITAYNGRILIMAPNHNPVELPLSIISIESLRYQAYMEMITEMTQQRYNKISLMNTILKDGLVDKSDIEVTTRSGFKDISTPSEEIIIKNLSNRTLSNVRIMIPDIGTAFLLDKYNIEQIGPNGEASIRMIPLMDTSKYSPKDYRGEIIIAPENAVPRAIPVHIPATPRHDSTDEFQVLIFGDEMTTATDSIYIWNTGNRTMDSVKIMLDNNLARVFSLSQDSFQRIEPTEQVKVEVKYSAKDLRTFMQNFNGTVKIVSEHHGARIVPVNIQWNKVESDNFVVYARNGDQGLASDVLKHLEIHQENVTQAFGTVNNKATIYIAGSLEEMQLLNYYGYSFYSYTDDTIFVCACDAKDSALQEYIYRAMINNFPTYYNMKKIDNDHENWLVDGIAKYNVVKNNETALMEYVEAFKQEPTVFQWYGSSTDAQYGATITFFKYLEETYGEDAIYRSLYHLGSGMVSNHRCDTVENCAVLRGVYDASGMDMDKKRFSLDFETLVNEWVDYVNRTIM